MAPPDNDDPNDTTPHCYACHEQVGLTNDSAVILQGQWMYSTEYDMPIFVLDPDTKLVVIELPNQQLALVPDQEGCPTIHVDKTCLEIAFDDAADDDDDDDNGMTSSYPRTRLR